MAKMVLSTLQTTVQSWLDSTKQANGTYSITTNNIYSLVDKIGKLVTIDGDFQDKLPELDGDNLPFGTTIEEYFLDLILPEVNSFDQTQDGTSTIPYRKPIAEAPAYNYTFGKKRIVTSEPYNNIERACLTAEDASNLVTKIIKRLTDSKSIYKYALKKQLLGNAIDKAITASLKTTLAVPTDTTTSEAFIKKAKELVENASFANEGNSLTNTLIGASPSLTLYIKKGVMPTVEVDALAGAFNEAKMAIPATIKVLDDFGKFTDDAKVWAFLVDTRGVKLHAHYEAVRTDESGYDDYVTFTDHSEYTGFISKFVFMHVLMTA